MRHRGESGAARSVVSGVTSTFTKVGDILAEEQVRAGKHRAPASQPRIPTQKKPTHDSVPPTEPVTERVEEPHTEAAAEVETPVGTEASEQAAPVPPLLQTVSFPRTAQWKASHGPRIFAATLLLLAVAGTSALGLEYAQTHETDQLISVVIGVGVVVGLWALLIASTPQVVSLRGSVLTVRNSSGSVRFDLADGLQPVDVVGEPRSSHWALLLHRPNNTSVVLRRRDVDAVALDPIVRHYRSLAEQRWTDRQVRFSR